MIIVVTGASSGIGKAAATELAKQGHQVVLVCRNRDKGEATKKEIIEKTGNEQVSLECCDLTVHESIRNLGVRLRERFDHIDVLVNNAGGINKNRVESPEGWEMTFALNHMGYFLVAHYLLDLLKAAPKARMVCVSSVAHRMAKADLSDLQCKKGYHMWRTYGLSKLCNILFVREFTRRYSDVLPHITANALHPGSVGTNFGSNDPGVLKFLIKNFGFLLLTPEKGAETIVHLATSPAVEGISGVYFEKCVSQKTSAAAKSNVLAAELWEESLRLAGIKDFGDVGSLV
jgi:NAD(P)-dependent dehydrogenase (short-subunit alcohol dehydrogenase family)